MKCAYTDMEFEKNIEEDYFFPDIVGEGAERRLTLPIGDRIRNIKQDYLIYPSKVWMRNPKALKRARKEFQRLWIESYMFRKYKSLVPYRYMAFKMLGKEFDHYGFTDEELEDLQILEAEKEFLLASKYKKLVEMFYDTPQKVSAVIGWETDPPVDNKSLNFVEFSGGGSGLHLYPYDFEDLDEGSPDYVDDVKATEKLTKVMKSEDASSLYFLGISLMNSNEYYDKAVAELQK